MKKMSTVIQKIQFNPKDSKLSKTEKLLLTKRQIPPFSALDPLLVFKYCHHDIFPLLQYTETTIYILSFDFTQSLVKYSFLINAVQNWANNEESSTPIPKPIPIDITFPFEYHEDIYHLYIKFTCQNELYEYVLPKYQNFSLEFKNCTLVFSREESILNDLHFSIHYSKFRDFNAHFSFQ